MSSSRNRQDMERFPFTVLSLDQYDENKDLGLGILNIEKFIQCPDSTIELLSISQCLALCCLNCAIVMTLLTYPEQIEEMLP